MSLFIVYRDRQKFRWMYFTELRIISHGKDGKSHGKSWNFLELKKYEPWYTCKVNNFINTVHYESINRPFHRYSTTTFATTACNYSLKSDYSLK